MLRERYNFEYGLYLKALCEEHGYIPTTMQESCLSRLSFRGIYYSIKVDSSVSMITRRWKDAYVKELNIVITNLVACVNKGKYLQYSRNKTSNHKHKYNKKGIKNSRIMRAVEILESKGYCLNFIASSKQNPRKRMMPSFIQPTQEFINEFCTMDEIMTLAEQAQLAAMEHVVLRDVNGKDMDYRDNDKSIEARNLVIKLNTISSNCTFKRKDGSSLENFVSRIFNLGDTDFGYGGRFARSEIQVMPNRDDDRLFITIDDQDVIEVDYSNLHIRLLTDLRGIDYSKYKDTDLYHMPLSDDELTADNRWLIKQAVNIMFNCANERAAMAAIQDKIRHEPDRVFSFKGPKEVVTAIKAAYPWLADDFCQPVPRGHYLMNLDSWIAHDVGTVFADKGLPIGIIHDSFIVQSQYKEMLVSAMVAAYRKRTEKPNAKVYMKAKWALTSPLSAATIYEESIII